MKFTPTVIKKRPFKIWPKNKRFTVKLSNSSQYFPTKLLSLTFLAHNSFYISNLRFRRVVVKSTSYGYLSMNSIEAFRKVIAPNFRKKKSKIYKFLIRCYPFLPLTKKPAEVRMGGGKGSKIRGFFSPVRPGQVLFEVFCRDPKSTKSIMLYASRKISVSTEVVFYLFSKMAFVNNNSKVWVSDNTGVTKIRNIIFYKKKNPTVSNIFVGSIARVKARRKIKKGQIFRAILIQSRFPVFRAYGSYIRSLATRSILIKRGEYVPISNRVAGFFFYELKLVKEYKFNSLTVYII